MIQHLFDPSKYHNLFNAKSIYLRNVIDKLNNVSCALNGEYWGINKNEELLCPEETLEYNRKIYDFSDD